MKYYDKKFNLLLYLQNCRCFQCGRYDRFEIDHILPKRRRGKLIKTNPVWIDEIFNLRLLCPVCHKGKRPRGFKYWHIEKINNLLNKQEVLLEELDFIEDVKLKQHFKKCFDVYIKEFLGGKK